jgi:hypothetical protein
MKPKGQNGGNMKIGTLKALSHAVSAPWVLVFAISVLAIGICPSLAMGDDGDHRSIQVVTFNLDEGTDYNEVIAALLSGEFKAFQQAVLLTINNVKATNPLMAWLPSHRKLVTRSPTWSVCKRQPSGELPTARTPIHRPSIFSNSCSMIWRHRGKTTTLW